MTHTIFVKDFLSCNMKSLRIQCVYRYSKFLRSLVESVSKEVCILSRLVANDVSTNTGKNVVNIKLETRESPFKTPSKIIENSLISQDKSVFSDSWNVWLLRKYIEIRQEQRSKLDNMDYIDNLIGFLRAE